LTRYKRKSVEVGVYRRGESLWAQISHERGRRPPTTVCVRKLQCTLLCGIKTSAVHCLILSESTRVIDGQTDRRTDRQTNRIMTAKTALA